MTYIEYRKRELALSELTNKGKNMQPYTCAYTENKVLSISKDNQYLSLDKDTGATELYPSLKAAKADVSRKLREGKEFLILKLVATVRPKPLDAEIDEYE